MAVVSPDTIAAIATPPGRGGIGVVRVCGDGAASISQALIGRSLPPRRAVLATFRDAAGEAIDQGIALFFPAPGSYTGEPTLELQAHGSPVVLDVLLARVLELGARLARPGEFTERAFLNGKLDLTQAEAVADLIASTNATQARLASRTLRGALAEQVGALQLQLTELRVRIEADLDFADEDIDPVDPRLLAQGLDASLAALGRLLALSHQGERVRDGLALVIAGAPNAGKSSLLNRLSGRDAAIVTATPGTTRDLIRAEIQLDGMPLHLIDTAGIRESDNPIEQEGMRRAREEIRQADVVLWLYDATAEDRPLWAELRELAGDRPLTLVRNKIDLLGEKPGLSAPAADSLPCPQLCISAKTGAGFDALRAHLKERAGYQAPGEGAFLARRRHVLALERAREQLASARTCVGDGQPGEIVAEHLRLAQKAFDELTGEFSAEDLLGEIFASFCIGK
jgi:tRNA modification GTPase